MHRYGVRDVEKLLSLSRSTIRSLVEAGFVSPTRGPRRAWRFSFQDLIVLRTAKALVAASVPRRRITRSIRELRRNLPGAMPLSGLAICAVGDRVVVRQGASRWQAESGQYLLEFEGDPAAGALNVIERAPAAERPAAPELVAHWFAEGLRLEGEDPQAALAAYERALAADPACADAHVNRGRLLHQAGRLAEAEEAYREGMRNCAEDAILLFNVAVLLEDMDRKGEAVSAYRAALTADPLFADCHYNLALLCEELGASREAIRHMAEYRRLNKR
jgi:tetratricopeptide (TPR) repeat protein